jgi:hypothetical protein
LPSLGEYASGQITVGSGITTTNEARTVIAQQIGLAKNQALVNAAATAANTYGINSFEAISAVNTAEAAADSFAAQLIGAQNYINGLSAIETTQIVTASSTGIMPTDINTLMERAQLIAFANPGVDFSIPANMIPNANINDPSVPMEYRAVDGVESLESPGGDSSELAALLSYNVSTVLIEEESGSNPSYTEFDAGGGDMPNVGWGAVVTDEGGVVNAWLAGVQLATAAGVDSNFLASLSRNLQYDSDESDPPHACDTNCVGLNGVSTNGPTITLSAYLEGVTSAWAVATVDHEIGHTLTPNEVAWAQVAADNYNSAWDATVEALNQYGVGSEQYYVASLPLASDWNNAVQAGINKELVATVIGAQIFGNAYKKSGTGTFADGVQTFINAYIGEEGDETLPTYNPPTNSPSSVNTSNIDAGLDYHGTPLQQVISIANANLNVTITVPEHIIQQAVANGEISPNDYVPGATYTIIPTAAGPEIYYTVPAPQQAAQPQMPDIAPPPPPADAVSTPASPPASLTPATNMQPAADAASQQDVAANDGTTMTVASVVDDNPGDISSGDFSDSFTSADGGNEDIYMGGPDPNPNPACNSENSCQ